MRLQEITEDYQTKIESLPISTENRTGASKTPSSEEIIISPKKSCTWDPIGSYKKSKTLVFVDAEERDFHPDSSGVSCPRRVTVDPASSL
jgi:hypothetical protein